MEPVVVVNPMEVPEGRDEEFLAPFRATSAYLRRQEGFVSGRLHVALNPQARFRYVATAVWQSPEHFQRAIGSDEFKRLSARIPFQGFPSLYRVDE